MFAQPLVRRRPASSRSDSTSQFLTASARASLSRWLIGYPTDGHRAHCSCPFSGRPRRPRRFPGRRTSTSLPDLPDLADGRRPQTLVLAGAVGGSLWPAFRASLEARDGRSDPLDRWTRRVLGEVAHRLGAVALYPFGGPPHYPFQRWALRAEPLHSSPLGLLIHPEYGLWHAWRGALLFADDIALPAVAPQPSPCASCADKPCLSTCPVGAFSGTGYHVDACAGHIAQPAGVACLAGGCLARHACPVGRNHAYGADQQAFHMQAFLAARRRASSASDH